jgi:glycosyltransferase involved in cell wall biosynthesis
LKIALLADQIFNPSGVGVYTRQLVHNLLGLETDNRYVILFPGRADLTDLAGKNVELVALPDRRLLYPLWHIFGWPPLEVFTGEVDLVHFIAGSVRLPCRAPLIVGVTDLSSERFPRYYPWRRRWFKHRLLRAVSRRGQSVIAISHSTGRDVEQLFAIPSEKVFVTPLGVDLLRFQPAGQAAQALVREKYRLPDRFFLFVGGISPRKNIERLVAAFSRLDQSRRETVHLVLAGPQVGWQTDLAAHLQADPDASRNIHHIGFIEDADLPALYSAAYAFVYPSIYEGFGLPVLEAMACGTPVICSNSSSLPEVAGEAGLTFSPLDVDGLAAALEAVQDPRLCDRLVRLGCERVKSFQWKVTAEKTAAVYQQVAGRVN